MGAWNHGLFGCFSDFKLCVLTYFAPCYTAGKVGESVGDDGVKWAALSLVPLVNIFCLAKLRGKVRDKKGIDGTLLVDCLLHWFCGCCALQQEAQEMNAVNVDSIQADAAKEIQRV